MADGTLSLSDGFDEATEADWLAAVEKALKGGGIERITRQTRDGIKIQPLYRETDFASSTDPRGAPGAAPYLRGGAKQPDRYLPWDIRQTFAHPDPAETNQEIIRDLERGVSSIHVVVDNTAAACSALEEAGIPYTQRDVICVNVVDRPGALRDAAFVMSEAGVNIDSVYGAIKGGVIFGVDDVDGATQVAAGLDVMKPE